MWRLMKYLKGYEKESILGPLFKLLESYFELMVPVVMAKIIDIGIKNQDFSYVFQMGGVLLFLGVIGLVCSVIAQYYAAKAAVGFGTGLRNDLFHKIMSFSYQEIDKVGTASLITRMVGDTNQIQSGVNLVLRLFLRSPFIVLGAMVMAFTIHIKAALIFVVMIPLLSIVVFGIMILSMPLYKKVQRQLEQVMGLARQNLSGVRIIRAFNRQEREMETFEQENTKLVSFQVFVGKISALLNPLTYVLINLGIVALLYFGGLQIEHGDLSQGEVVALVNYMSQILIELIKLANFIIVVSKALASVNRIATTFSMESELMEEGRKKVPFSNLEAYKLEFQDVSLTYEGLQQPILSNISLSIKSGETLGVIGGTGSGKTTFVNLIPRFYEVTKGRILLDGISTRDYSLKELRSKIGVVPQQATLFRGTIRDNLKFGNEYASDEALYEALSIAQAETFVNEKKEGLDFYIQQGGKNLSGGQRQRLTIARALVGKPEILIFDDSASALDSMTDARLRKALKSRNQEVTSVIVSQRMSAVYCADQILVLEEGNVVGLGSHDTLLKNCRVYQEIYDSQIGTREEVCEL